MFFKKRINSANFFLSDALEDMASIYSGVHILQGTKVLEPDAQERRIENDAAKR